MSEQEIEEVEEELESEVSIHLGETPSAWWPDMCPRCSSGVTYQGRIDVGLERVTVEYNCNDCHLVWAVEFNQAGLKVFDVPKNFEVRNPEQ